jgi:hypothetical protein
MLFIHVTRRALADPATVPNANTTNATARLLLLTT